MIVADPQMEFMFAKVRNVRQKFEGVPMHAVPVMIQPMCDQKPPSRGE
jgi:hypothetical protein